MVTPKTERSPKSSSDGLRVGLYGGTFDPIHIVHLIIAEFIREERQLDRVIFIPSGIPPHKQVFSPKELRLKMVEACVADHPKFECSDIEITRTWTSYSVDTIAAFRRRLGLPADRLFWILGSDNFVSFDKWKEPERILEWCRVVVFPRRHGDFERAPARFRDHPAVEYLDAPILEVSSTQIREFVRKGRSIRYLVPPAVEGLIRENDLYK